MIIDYSKPELTSLKQEISRYSQILVLSYNLTKNAIGVNDIFKVLNEVKVPYVMLSCRNPYDIVFAPSATTNLLLYGISGFDQTNYQVNKFMLNLRAGLEKLFDSSGADSFNTFCPVSIL